ncbi:histidine-rich glycoprotein-like [Homarus americanus]|uniref:histidine-rich glycoprotein-like n=1 Tax=Homarus americanus TaxID=6706 RepID=UPI001C472BD7|nr:histidine-rich glycoprotein-like [Homarus americanus]
MKLTLLLVALCALLGVALALPSPYALPDADPSRRHGQYNQGYSHYRYPTITHTHHDDHTHYTRYFPGGHHDHFTTYGGHHHH